MARIHVKKARKDGKYQVVFCFDSGKSYNKIVDKDTLIHCQNVENYEVKGLWIDPMEWPSIKV